MTQPTTTPSATPKRAPTRVISAKFETSAPGLSACPPADCPEVALAGRSNVGKSSLLNALTGQRGLATVSRQPGRTRLLNFFGLRLRHQGEDYPMRIADLPGYGFAKAARSVRDTFGPMIQDYLLGRSSLRAVILLMDARRGPTELDIDMLSFAAEQNLPSLLCVTKVDKLSASQRGVLAKSFAKELNISPRAVSLTSAQNKMGLCGDGKRHDLLSSLGDWVHAWATPSAPEQDDDAGPEQRGPEQSGSEKAGPEPGQ